MKTNKVPARPLPARHAAEPPPVVSGRWLLIAMLVTMAAAVVCVYATLCLLFYQGQWQFLFHPSRNVTSTPASLALDWTEIHFDTTDAGVPRLDGWWIPAPTGGRYAADTVLYLHDGHGSLSDTLPALTSLHALGINVFAFDYRGFGKSTAAHPTERLATADATAAWTYLTDLRHIPGNHIVVFGNGTGATFAASLGTEFAPAGIVLEDPGANARQIFDKDRRARVVPLWLLQNERLDPAPALAHNHGPKLILSRQDDSARAQQLFQGSAYPKHYFDLRGASPETVNAAMLRFLDEVLR